MKYYFVMATMFLNLSFAQYYMCNSTNNPYDEYVSETDMVAKSNCFYSFNFKKTVSDMCKKDYQKIFPQASTSYVENNVEAMFFFTLKNCQEVLEDILQIDYELMDYDQIYVDNRKYFILSNK